MRYRLMASYLGASYQAAVGPSDRDVTLFAAPPPPEEHGFSPAPGGIWRKQVRLGDLDALWESRPIGSYHSEPCLVLDDLGDRLHIVYLGMDGRRAAQLGYWEVDRGVFEVVVPRHEVTDLAEERHEFPISLLLSALPRALGAGDPGAGSPAGPGAGRGGAPAGTGGHAVPSEAGGALVPADEGGSGPGPNGMSGWGGPAGQQQFARGYQLQAQAGQQQLTPGQQGPGGQQGTGSQQPAFAQLAGAPGGQQAAPDGSPLSAPAMQPPGRPQLPAAQQPMNQQPVAQQPMNQQPVAQQFMGAPPLPQAMTAGQGGTAGQAGTAQPAAFAQPPQAPGPQTPAAQQAQFSPAPVNQPQFQPPTAAQPPGPQAPAPTAVAAWHGSPASDGNGTWYYQPFVDPQQNGITAVGQPANGASPNGYAQPGQGGVPAAPVNGAAGTQQYAQPGQPVAGSGYQQAPPLPSATVQQAQPAQQAPAQQAPAQQAPAQQAPPGPVLPTSPVGLAAPAAAISQPQPVYPVAQPAPAAPGPQPVQLAPAPTAAPVAAVPPPTAQPGAMVAPADAVSGPATIPLTASPAGPAPVAQAPAATAPEAPQAAPLYAAPTDTSTSGPLTALPAPPAPAGPSSAPAAPAAPAQNGLTAGGPLSKLTGAVRGRRAARKPRLAMSAIFADLVDMADIPRSAYAVDEEVTGSMCLFKTDGGYEVFSCAEDARHEVRFFEEEEAAYFYLFGVLAAEALRNGRLTPRRG
jgi:hypothetical protein